MDRLSSLPSPVSPPWESAPPVAMETAREASARLGLSPRALIGRAIRRGHLAPSPPGRPPAGQSVRLPPTVWGACKRRVKHAPRTRPCRPGGPSSGAWSPWSPEEDAAVLALPMRGRAIDWDAAGEALRGRTRRACVARRWVLRRAVQTHWTPAEDAIVVAGYPRDPWPALLAALPGRTRNGINRRVERLRTMGIAVNTRRAAGVGRRERE